MEHKWPLGFSIAKQSVDLLLALFGLIVLMPLFLIIAVCIRLDSPGPALYLSKRMGKDGQLFTLYKFRTMFLQSKAVRGADGSYLVFDDDPRVTRVGRVLRTGLDELPQLLNVLIGQMSLIGPRADPPDAYELYDDAGRKRLLVRPGISGLAQVNGRTRLSLAQRGVYDLAYVESQSAMLDTCIFCLTIFEIMPFLAKRSQRFRLYLARTTQQFVVSTS